MDNLNGIESVIRLTREHESLKNALDELVLYIVAKKRGHDNLMSNYDIVSIDFIKREIDSLFQSIESQKNNK